MNGDELKRIFDQLDDRGKHHVEVVALAELKHAREGLQKANNGVLVANSQDSLRKGKRRNEG